MNIPAVRQRQKRDLETLASHGCTLSIERFMRSDNNCLLCTPIDDSTRHEWILLLEEMVLSKLNWSQNKSQIHKYVGWTGTK